VPPLPPGDRFLFLVDTSSGMSRLGHASRQAVFNMIWTGLNGHFCAGDTLGLWTFSDEPHPGKLPMQTWETNALDLASRVGRFLRDQPYGKRADLGAAMEQALVVVKHIQDVTIFVISDGASPIAHTPFDEAINAIFKERSSTARQQKRPLITTLVARRGSFVRWSVTWPEEDVPMPERASRPLVAQPPTNAASAALSPTVARPPRAAIIITNARPKILLEENVAHTASQPPVDTSVSPTAPEIVPASPLSVTNVSTPTRETSTTSEPTNVTVAPLPVLLRTAAPPVTLRLKDTALVGSPSATSVVAEVPAPAPSAQPAATSAAPTSVPESLAPLTVAAREPGSNAAPAGPMLAVTPTPARQAPFSPLLMLAIGAGLLLAALGLTLIFLHRLRQTPQPSFISQSLSRTPRPTRPPPGGERTPPA
jgi:hypothetical protein